MREGGEERRECEQREEGKGREGMSGGQRTWRGEGECERRKGVHANLPHELKGDTEVVSEVEVLNHVNDVVLVVTIL